MNARKDLAGLVDAFGRARLYLVDRTAARPVDARQAKDIDGRAGLLAQCLPGPLGSQPFDAAGLAARGSP